MRKEQEDDRDEEQEDDREEEQEMVRRFWSSRKGRLLPGTGRYSRPWG